MPGETEIQKVALLNQVSLFSKLSESQLARLRRDFRLKTYPKGDLIFHQGDDSRELYLILQGKVRIFRISPAGHETTIDLFAPYDIIGELAAIDGRPRSASAQAIETVELLAMSHERFLHHLQTMPALALGVAQLLTRKLRWTAAYAEAVAQYDAAGRLLHILLLYAERDNGQALVPGQPYAVALGLIQAELASLVGVRREWINRVLSQWRRRGLVDYHGGVITLLDVERVRGERDSRIGAGGGKPAGNVTRQHRIVEMNRIEPRRPAHPDQTMR
jgi:CRP-like cAMP-binding protein